MNPLQMLWDLGRHVLEGEIGTDLNTLGHPLSIRFTEIADQRVVSPRRIETRYMSWASLLALSARRPKAPVFIHHHMELLFIIMNHRRIHRAGLFAFPLLFGALTTDILDGFRDGKEITIDSDS